MFSTILIVLIGCAIGAYIRHEARENRRPWLATAALAVLFLALTLLKPPGQEFFACWWAAPGGLAGGPLLFAAATCVRRNVKKETRPCPHGHGRFAVYRTFPR